MKNDNRFGELGMSSQMPMENLPMGGRIEKKAKSPRSPINGKPKSFDLKNGKDCMGESPKKGDKGHGKK